MGQGESETRKRCVQAAQHLSLGLRHLRYALDEMPREKLDLRGSVMRGAFVQYVHVVNDAQRACDAATANLQAILRELPK